jgi:predicted O-methyltransferase YrrM
LLVLSAVRYLERLVNAQTRVFEYGAGGSTLFFARRVQAIFAVEHDRKWAEKVSTALHARGYANGRVLIAEAVPRSRQGEADPSDPRSYATSDDSLRHCSFQAYASSIDQFPDRSFDLIVIDGRARPSCFMHAIPKLASAGYVVWDNSERAVYEPTLRRVAGEFHRLDFFGPVPGNHEFSQTTVLRRRSAS